MTHLEQLLERIAISLEKIAGTSQTASATPFPWGDSRVDTRLNSMRNWRDDRPETFEGLLSIGRRALANSSSGKTRNIGETSIARLDAIFEEHGFGDRWMSS